MPSKNTRIDLPASNWQWRLSSSNGSFVPDSISTQLPQWHPCSTFPSVIHQELLHSNLIPDANVGENERRIQWIGKCDWEYRCTFRAPSVQSEAEHAELLFEGLDTFAIVTLNGKVILNSDNMFISHRVDVKQFLQSFDQDNELVILFESAFKKGGGLEEEHGVRFSIMRDAKRMHIRKAQYHWGWDWGQLSVQAGPYMPIYLETYRSRISDLYIETELAGDHSHAKMRCDSTLSGSQNPEASIELAIVDEAGAIVSQTTYRVSTTSSTTSHFVTISSPRLWWPNLQGNSHLYTATARLMHSSSSDPLDTRTTRFGIRTVHLIQRPLSSAPGSTFLFSINGREIFINGANWIPCDNILSSITPDRYHSWIQLARRCNMNMLRIWGGGIYESEDFYNACDELGILVWQDYAFACGDYPTHPSFLASVREEAEQQTRRLRSHASLALLCGGNEDFMLTDMAPEFNRPAVPYDPKDTKGPFLDTSFPQREIYLNILPSVAAALAPDIPYWPNSPWGGAEANDPTVGDIHQWDVWHGKQSSYQDYKRLSGRFVSEFGMHAYPDLRTVLSYAPNPADQHPQSKVIDCHNKGHGAEVRIARYLAENFRYSNNKLDDFVYCTQLLQAEAYGYALRDWRRLFKGKGSEECAGAMVWQFNDVYACTSWSFVDYWLRPKPSFYVIARAFAPVSVGIERRPWTRWVDEDETRESEIPTFEVWGCNSTTEEVRAKLQLDAWDMHTQKRIKWPNAERDVVLVPGYTTEFGQLTNPESLTDGSLVVLCAKLVDREGRVLARIVNWPEPYRYLRWPKDTRVAVHISKDDEEWEAITLEANYPVKGCLLSLNHVQDVVEAGEPIWEDNMLDLMPHESVILRVKERQGRDVKIRFLSDWEL